MDDPTLRTGGTGGLVVRRGAELLFVPDGGENVLGAFDASAPGSAVEAVTVLYERGDIAGAAFVVVDWTDGLRLAVNGDIDVTSNQPSLPRLNPAGAGTWVERSLRAVEFPVRLGVAVDTVHPLTNLIVGIVVAGAFELVLESTTPSSTNPAVQGVEQSGSAASDYALPAPDEAADVVPNPSSAAPPQPETPLPSADATSRSDPTDPTLLPTEALSMPDDVVGGGKPADASLYEFVNDDETTVPAAKMRALVDSLVDDQPVPSPPQTDWQLRIVGRGVEPMQGTTILGRSPSPRDGDDPAATHLLEIEGLHLSRSHLAVEVGDGTISLVDLGSRNGSFIVTSGDGQLAQLEPGVARRVDAGTIAQIGSVRFHVERRS